MANSKKPQESKSVEVSRSENRQCEMGAEMNANDELDAKTKEKEDVNVNEATERSIELEVQIEEITEARQAGDELPQDEISIFIRADELDKTTAKAIYDFAAIKGYRLAIKAAQRVAKCDENGVMSNEALKAINSVNEAEFLVKFKAEADSYL